jgi:hypothetical protein
MIGLATLDVGARVGNRTLNLGIKRLPTDRLRSSQGVVSASLPYSGYDAVVSESLLVLHGVSPRSCQIGGGRGGLEPPTSA